MPRTASYLYADERTPPTGWWSRVCWRPSVGGTGGRGRCDDVVCACPSPQAASAPEPAQHRRQGGACCNNKIYLYMRKNANTVNRCSGSCASDSAAVFVCLLHGVGPRNWDSLSGGEDDSFRFLVSHSRCLPPSDCGCMCVFMCANRF